MVSLEVFAVDPPISRYNFLPELVDSFYINVLLFILASNKDILTKDVDI
jgi:hypothetical protein